jgi:hypothetical protein
METKKQGYVQRAMASLCHYCPVCRYGRKKPDSLVGRMLHHPLHADRCPFWKAEQEKYSGGTGGRMHRTENS